MRAWEDFVIVEEKEIYGQMSILKKNNPKSVVKWLYAQSNMKPKSLYLNFLTFWSQLGEITN